MILKYLILIDVVKAILILVLNYKDKFGKKNVY